MLCGGPGSCTKCTTFKVATRELPVTAQMVQIAIDIVVTITTEMRLFHHADDDASTLLMRRVH